MIDANEPACINCRWAQLGKLPTKWNGPRGGTDFGLAVYQGVWEGFRTSDDGTKYHALGVYYCEHPKQPRGLVLTNYTCPNFERDDTIDMSLAPKLVGSNDTTKS